MTATADKTTTELAVFDPTFLPATQSGTDEQFDTLAQGADYLASMKLYGANSKECKTGKIPIGHYGIREDAETVIDLGDTIDVLPLARRPKALDWSDRNNVIAVHDMERPEFKRIAEESQENESECAVGPSFLLYERSTGRLLEFFCGSKSAQRAAKQLYAYLPLSAEDVERRGLEEVEPRGPQPATLKVKFIERKFSWHAPTVHKCSTPFTSLPAAAEIRAEVEKFVNCPAVTSSGDSEEASEEEQAAARRAR